MKKLIAVTSLLLMPLSIAFASDSDYHWVTYGNSGSTDNYQETAFAQHMIGGSNSNGSVLPIQSGGYMSLNTEPGVATPENASMSQNPNESNHLLNSSTLGQNQPNFQP